jgi:hypothetical protein
MYISMIQFTGNKIINKTLTLLYIGGSHPKQKLTVFVKGKEIKKQVNFKVGDKWHFAGKAFLYKKKPAITITNTDQLATRILI